jgi:hypothetical protein
MTRCLREETIFEIELQSLFPRNLIHDPQHTLDGMLVLKCFFCNDFQTPIEYGMKIHLRYTHRKELVTHLPIRGKGFNMDYRTAFVIDFLKRRKPPQFYDHRTAEFVPLDKPEIQKVRTQPSNPNSEQNLYNYMN